MKCKIKCAIESCRATKITHPNRRFFMFPQDETLLEIWREKCKLSKSRPLKSLKLCQVHFDSKNIGIRKLAMGSVPEYYLTDPNIKIVNGFKINGMSFKNFEVNVNKKIGRLTTLIQFYKKENKILKSVIKKHRLVNSIKPHISKLPNLNLLAKEFGRVFLNDSLKEWPCAKCMETIKDDQNVKEEKFSPDMLKLEQNDDEQPKSNFTISEDTSLVSEEGDEISPDERSWGSASDKESVSIKNEKIIYAEEEVVIEDGFLDVTLETYACEKCNVKSNSYKQLIRHLSFHRDAYLYECERCGKEFHKGCMYRDHALVYQVERPHVCKICGKDFKTPKYLKRHEFRHITERTVPCPLCGKMFSHKQALHNHHFSTHKEKCKACTLCDATFKLKVSLRHHMSKVHGISESNKTTAKKTVKTERTLDFACEICGKLVTTELGLKLHIRNIHKKDRPFPCSYCSKTFINVQLLKCHMQFHINKKNSPVDPKTKDEFLQFNCDECDKSFTDSRFLKQHKILHSGLKEHTCEHCGKSFALKSYLKRHVRLNHETNHPNNFSCSKCGKVSRDVSHHNSHMLSHTGETPFACEFCVSKFRYKKSLQLHIKNKHSETV